MKDLLLPDSWPARSAKHFRVALLLTVLLALVASALWNLTAERRALERLPAGQRQSMYLRTLGELETLCRKHPAEGVRTHCRVQAEFILQFPECDAGCEQLARESLPRATR